MKKVIFGLFVVCALAFSIYFNAPNKSDTQQIWGKKGIAPTLQAVSDTNSLATYKTIVSYSGPGIVYKIMFNSTSASKDPSVIVIIDGTADTLTEASSEEVTRFVKRLYTPELVHNNQFLQAGDSLSTTLGSGTDLNLWFNKNFVVKTKTETGAAAITNCFVLWGKFEN